MLLVCYLLFSVAGGIDELLIVLLDGSCASARWTEHGKQKHKVQHSWTKLGSQQKQIGPH